MAAPKLWKHQVKTVAFAERQPRMLDLSDPGCVSANTEYLTPTGWKRIDQYREGDKVAQFHPTTREIEFVEPLEYVKRPCTRMIAIAPVRGVSQRLSHEHRVLYYNEDGSHGVCSAQTYMTDLHRHGPNHLKKKFCVTFSVKNDTSIQLSYEQLRVMVAVIADGHFSNNTNRCTVRLKKTRKIERLRRLLADAGIEYDEITCGGEPDFQVFRFNAPRREKEFGLDWWKANQNQLEVIADELPHWDGSVSLRPSKGIRFDSYVQATAEFAQYAFAAAKHPTSIQFVTHKWKGRPNTYGYVVQAQAEDKLIGPGRKNSVFEISNPEGFKYCFEVPSSFLLLRHNGYIFATGNTAKTRPQLEAFAKRRKRGGGCALVLATRSILRSAWANDSARFTPGLKVEIAYAKNRAEAFAASADVYVTNHDAVRWLAQQSKAFFAKFDTLIIDEIPAYKHHTSARSKAVNKIKKYFNYRVGLTGTPNTNTICDIWHPAFIIDDGVRLGKSFFAFRSSVCKPEQVGPRAEMVRWVDKEGAEEVVFDRLSDITIRHRAKDCLDIPPTHTHSMPYYLTDKQMKVYVQMQALQIAQLEKAKVISAVNAAAVYTKLLQISSGAVYSSDSKYEVIDTERYEMVMDLCEERKHPIVAFQWVHQRDLLIKEAQARKMKYAVIDGTASDKQREEIVTAYQNGWYDVLFGHPLSMAHGLTLTRGTSIIWPCPTANLEWWEQFNRRQARGGQTEKTEVLVLVAPNTIEEKVYTRCMEKGLRMELLLDLFSDARAA